MLDMFTKSKVEPDLKRHTPQLDQPHGLEDAWRIAHAIDSALKVAESEREALTGRIEDATAWAAVSLGNGNDEYLERESLDTLHLDRFDAQIRNGNKYVVRLDRNIEHFKSLRAALLTAFPEITLNSAVGNGPSERGGPLEPGTAASIGEVKSHF